jgi:YVTN family beta-propeller protein
VVSASGRTVVTANGGPVRYSLTVLERDRKGPWTIHHLAAPKPVKPENGEEKAADGDDWRSVFMGLAFAGEHAIYASEGNSGRVRLIDLASGSRRRIYDLNQNGFADSYTCDLAFDSDRGVLYVVDQANFRLVAIDTRKNQILSSLRLGRLPFAIALSPDRRRAYVTNLGMFEYKALPGADIKQALETGLPFPAFGFPSPEAERGVVRESARGPVEVPGLGDPNARESNSVAVVDVADPAAPKLTALIRTGLPFGGTSSGGSSPSGVIAAGNRIYVSNAHNDTITVIDASSLAVEREIPIGIPGLEKFRGVMPLGLAYHPASQWLLVAEAGINAVGVIDTRTATVIGHLPVGWFPSRIAVDGDTTYVANARGNGAGPNHDAHVFDAEDFMESLRRGTVSVFTMPPAQELERNMRVVMQANGFLPRPDAAAPAPAAIRYVVLIVKENRTFDEVFGDIGRAASGPVMGAPGLARFGSDGYVDGDRQRLSLHHINVTPNHHSMAQRWSFGDNFYTDSDVSVDGHHWLVGSYPDAWTEATRMAGRQKDFRFPTSAPGRLLFPNSNSSVHPEEQPEAGTIWHHLARHGVSFRNFGEGFELAGVDEGAGLKPTGARFLTNVPMPAPLYENTSRQYPGFNMNIPDQFRASQFISEVRERYLDGGKDLPRFIFLHLPNDHMARPRPADGYPYEASYVADNDYALGRIMEFLSGTKWWKQMAVFVTEDDAQGGIDHIDAHRTVLLAAGPYCKRGYVSHTNTSFPGLLKTIFRMLGVPPLNLFDAAASDLSDCFTAEPDFSPYRLEKVDKRIFDPALAKDPADPAATQSPRMDDASEIERQRRK